MQSTAPLASIFISLQHNVTEAGEIPFYTSGIKDWAAVFFYSLICIVIQAIIQEYVLDVSTTYFLQCNTIIKINGISENFQEVPFVQVQAGSFQCQWSVGILLLHL